MLPVVVLRPKVLEILKKKVQTSTLYLVKSYIMQIDKISNALNTKVEFPFFLNVLINVYIRNLSLCPNPDLYVYVYIYAQCVHRRMHSIHVYLKASLLPTRLLSSQGNFVIIVLVR